MKRGPSGLTAEPEGAARTYDSMVSEKYTTISGLFKKRLGYCQTSNRYLSKRGMAVVSVDGKLLSGSCYASRAVPRRTFTSRR